MSTPVDDRFHSQLSLQPRLFLHTAIYQTIGNGTVSGDFTPWCLYTGAVLTQRHCQQRQLWVIRHDQRRQRERSTVWFSDESRYVFRRHDGRRRVYKTHVMVWGAISSTSRSPLIRIQDNLTAQVYTNNIITPHVPPLLQCPGAIFQQDNARSLTATFTVTHLNQKQRTETTLAVDYFRFQHN